MGWTVEIEGLDELDRDWLDACRALSDGARVGVTKGVAEGADVARTVHRWQTRTGDTEKGITGEVVTSTQGGAEGEIRSAAQHSTYLEEGTRPHEIRVRHAGALHWIDPTDGGDRFAQKVQHPGTQASPFMGPALLQAERTITREVELAEVEAAKIMNR